MITEREQEIVNDFCKRGEPHCSKCALPRCVAPVGDHRFQQWYEDKVRLILTTVEKEANE